MRRLLLLGLILLAAAPHGARADGLNLAWNDCGASPRSASEMSFDCADESRTFNIVGSFVPPGGITALSGQEVSILILSDKPALPDWWRLEDDGCRPGALGAIFTFAGLSGCTNYWGSQVAGGFIYRGGIGPGRGQIEMVAAKPSSMLGAVSSGREYYAFQITLAADGTNRCGNCAEGICVLFERLLLTQPTGYGNHVLTQANRSNYVSWQGGAGSCQAAGGRQTVRSTWGRLKRQFR